MKNSNTKIFFKYSPLLFSKNILFSILIVFLCIIPVNAQVINGDFEIGNYTGWTSISNCGVSSYSYPTFNGIYENHSLYILSHTDVLNWAGVQQYTSPTGYNTLDFDFYYPDGQQGNAYARVMYNETVIFLRNYFNSGDAVWYHDTINLTDYQNEDIFIQFWTHGNICIDNVILSGNGTVTPEPEITETLNYTQTEYVEFEDSVINYNISYFKSLWPDDDFYIYAQVPRSYSPYFHYAEFELTELTGQRSLEIGKKASVDIAPSYQECAAIIYKSNATDNYESMTDFVYANVSTYIHDLINFTDYDWPNNKSYITGSYVPINTDISDYIETDYLGYPDEQFTLWIYGYSNSNAGNVHDSIILDSALWAVSHPVTITKTFRPFIENNFNATLESYITVYRNGVTTQLTPTVYSSMWAAGYIPNNDTGYVPPDIPEEPDEPDLPINDTPPDNPITPDIPDIPTGTNTSINVSWGDGYYTAVNDTCDVFFDPIEDFTIYALSPIYLLNDSIVEFNTHMNTSFTQTYTDMGILTGSFYTITGSFPSKVTNLITYYLIWLILLIILKKR